MQTNTSQYNKTIHMIIVNILLLWCLADAGAQDEGDECISPMGEKGKYRTVNSYPIIKEWLRDMRIMGTCEHGNNLLFCGIELNSPTTMKPGDLSAKKCNDYYPFKLSAIVGPGAMPSLAREFPHMAIIGMEVTDNTAWICGGSLISFSFVLTAAHCLRSSKLVVRLGDLDLATDTDQAAPQEFYSKRIIPHPKYKRPSWYHDIGLIELEKPVKLTEYVAIACLDTRRDHGGTKLTATGWGKTGSFKALSSHLLKVDIDAVPHEICKKTYGNDSHISLGIVDDRQICAGSIYGDDTCQGDSGGPLQIMNEDKSSFIPVYDIVGVTSFGRGCGLAGVPGVYTRVYNYLSWIESIVWSETKC